MVLTDPLLVVLGTRHSAMDRARVRGIKTSTLSSVRAQRGLSHECHVVSVLKPDVQTASVICRACILPLYLLSIWHLYEYFILAKLISISGILYISLPWSKLLLYLKCLLLICLRKVLSRFKFCLLGNVLALTLQ